MKQLLVTLILISLYDIPGDRAHVVVQGCLADNTEKCVRVLVKKEALEDPKALDALANHLKEQLN